GGHVKARAVAVALLAGLALLAAGCGGEVVESSSTVSLFDTPQSPLAEEPRATSTLLTSDVFAVDELECSLQGKLGTDKTNVAFMASSDAKEGRGNVVEVPDAKALAGVVNLSAGTGPTLGRYHVGEVHLALPIGSVRLAGWQPKTNSGNYTSFNGVYSLP